MEKKRKFIFSNFAMKNFNKSLYNKVKIAEEKILINKRFREEYFELEEKIKENLKNA